MRKRNEDVDAQRVPGAAGDEEGIITALARGLAVLRAFQRGDGALGNQELARRTALPKATVSRLTYTLSRLGYLVYLPETANYRLGAGTLALGFTTLGAMAIRDIARPLMQGLADHCGGAVALGARDGLSMLYVENCRGPSAIQIALETGSHIKLATSAMGRAYIAGLPPLEREHVMAQLEEREGAHWPAMRDGLLQAFDDFETLGFIVSAGDWKDEVHAVGVPLAAGTGELSYALNCGGSSAMFPREALVEDYGPRLKAIAAQVRRALNQDDS